jgi:putative transposase
MLARLNTIFEELLEKWDCKLIEFNREEDHVHTLFQYHPDVELSKLVNNLKSVSSRKLHQELAEHLEQFYWKDVFWSGSYFVASCGGVTVSTLRKYIEAQETPEEKA